MPDVTLTKPDVRNVPPVIWTKPEEALTMGTLNPGALDHGLVAAVAVTVCTLESVTVPDVMVMGPVAVTKRPPEVVTGA